jgi:hypothetical protein
MKVRVASNYSPIDLKLHQHRLVKIRHIIPAITNKYLGYELRIFLAGFVITCTSDAIFVSLGKLTRLHGMPVVFAITSCAWIALSLFAAILFYFDNLVYHLSLNQTLYYDHTYKNNSCLHLLLNRPLEIVYPYLLCPSFGNMVLVYFET